MLPDSHIAPSNDAHIDHSGRHVDEQNNCLQAACISAREKEREDEPENSSSSSAALLACEFSEFTLAASKLEGTYRELQKQVSELNLELSERNAELKNSLSENEQMRLALQQIVDSMPCGVLVLDRHKKISMINPETKRLLGLDPKAFGPGSQRTLKQISAATGVNLEAACQSLPSSDLGQVLCIQDHAEKRWIEVCNRQLFLSPSGGKKPDLTILILRDVTAHKRAEDERESARKAMALAEITTVLAHEVRNPLASLELFAELIQNDEARRGEWISNLRAGIRTLAGTVNNVLSFHGSGALNLSSVPLSTIIDSAIRFVQPLADQAAVSLEWKLTHDHIRVMGNESALRQVVMNLVMNAIRHTPEGGTVSVSILPLEIDAGRNHERNLDHVVIEFSDTGCGIPPSQIARIFEAGFSGRGETSGLGLAVCARIMKQHGGRIEVSNILPTGARFRLDFPVLRKGLIAA